ncbi:hypothetical protein HPB50_028483 [Hyalomma asiaticum]|nr:hypothetical protein HPB50_028483 [Hyalomma asiaticum]
MADPKLVTGLLTMEFVFIVPSFSGLVSFPVYRLDQPRSPCFIGHSTMAAESYLANLLLSSLKPFPCDRREAEHSIRERRCRNMHSLPEVLNHHESVASPEALSTDDALGPKCLLAEDLLLAI